MESSLPRLPHHPEKLGGLRRATVQNPLRVFCSGCLLGWSCGVDGGDSGMGGAADFFLNSPLVEAVPFCPEDFTLGTPRDLPDIHGGDGFAVWQGKARVLDSTGGDCTEAMKAGAEAALELALKQRVELALLTDMSAACGSQVISDGGRLQLPRKYRRGVGVTTALFLKHGIPVCSQRDFHTLAKIQRHLDPDFPWPENASDHHQTAWYREYFSIDHQFEGES